MIISHICYSKHATCNILFIKGDRIEFYLPFAVASKNKKVAIVGRWITKWDAIEKSSFHSAQTIILLLLYPNLIF